MKIFNFIYAAIFAAVLSVFCTNITYSQIYEIEPDVNNCIPGKLSQAEKTKIIKLINDIRSRHKIAPITWNEEIENRPQAAALSLAAIGWTYDNNPHGEKPGAKCTTTDSDAGRKESNLSYSSAKSSYTDHIIGWLIDFHNQVAGVPAPDVGHRRLIINPFLKSTAYGNVYSSTHGDMSAFWGITGDAMGPSTCENDFIAYPYENYPPAWVRKDMYLSFNPILAS